MKKALILVYVTAIATAAFAQRSEVRYDLVLIESFDGIGTEYYQPVEIEVPVPAATSTLSSRYSATNLVDGDPTTTWVEGAPGYGEGTILTFDVDASAIPRTIAIWPGYQRSPELYVRNGRPSRLRISWIGFDPGSEERFFEIASIETNLIHTYDGRVATGPQYISIDSSAFIQNPAASELDLLTIEILEVDSDGSSDPDTCISEIRLYAEGRFVGVRSPGY